MHRLLLIEDDARLAGMVADYLGQAGVVVDRAPSVAQARLAVVRHRPDLVLMDVMLPDGDGLALTAEWRQNPRTSSLPILMLTARGDPADRILGLELGADDYLAKPFEPRELLARVRALLRRAQPGPTATEVIRVGDLELDVGARAVRRAGQPCELTGYQFDILLALARQAGRVLSRDQIMETLRGHSLEAYDRSIDVHVSRIRAVIEDDPRSPQVLLTVRGVGYLLARPSAASEAVQAHESPHRRAARS
ncbi:MAG: response regulator transcription factor [Betaproteobacteria bacterium]